MTDDVLRPVFGSQTALKHSGFCSHAQMEIDEGNRTLTCKTCGALLDPFDVHLQYARRERSWRYWDGERSKAEARVEELKAEEKRIKARMANASRKDADVAVQAEKMKEAKRRLEVLQRTADVRVALKRIDQLMGMPVDPAFARLASPIDDGKHEA